MLAEPRSYDVVQWFFGINSQSLKVESVRVTNGGTMTLMRAGEEISHTRQPGTAFLPAAQLAYGLLEMVEVLVGDEQTASRVRSQLRDKANAMKADVGGQTL